MITRKLKNNSGFVALMSAILISIILLLVAVNLSFSGFYARSDILDYELKEKSAGFAEACVDTALLKLVTAPSYSGGDYIDVDHDGTKDCYIKSLTGSIIYAQGYTNNNMYFTDLEVGFNPSDLSITSWSEVSNLP